LKGGGLRVQLLRRVQLLGPVRYTLGAKLVPPGFFPEHAIETGVKGAVDLEERVEVAVREFAVVISDVVCDHQEDLERELGGRHRNRTGVERNASRPQSKVVR
jgi:hypothetical protein